MEIIDLNIDANVVVPETVNVSGEVRANPINAGVTSIVINGVEQEIDQGQVSFSVPTKVSDVENDLGFIDRDVNDLTNYPRTNQLSEVAFSGSYDDLENKPAIPDVPTNVSAFTNDAGYITKSVNNLENYSKTNELSQVAFSGNYADLSNKPQIPSKTIVEVNAIQTTGVKIAEITVDGQSTDIYADQGGGGGTNVSVTETLSSGTKVANILVDGQDNNIYVPTIPSNVSSFNNDAGYVTNSDLSGFATTTYVDNGLATKQDVIDISNKLPASNVSGLATVATTGSYNDLSNKPTIPSISGLASENYVDSSVSTHNSSGTAHTDIRNDISSINEKIPSAATSQNQLADKAFVNSTINSIAAFFRGTYADQLALLAVAWQTSDPDAPNYVSNNDYAYVQEVVAGSVIGTWDPADHLGEAWRFLYVSGEGWQPQFMVNETPFTQAQLNAINSGVTSNDVAQIGTNTAAIAGKQDEITSSNKLSASLVSGLSGVATSGSYNDLSNKPDLSVYAESSSLATVATSGSYNDLENKPSIPIVPTNVSSFNNDSGYITKDVNDLTNYTTTSNLATVATSGDYDDLENKPTIPVVPTNVSSFTNDSGYITKSVNNLDNYTPTSSLSSVATSGAYSDLSGTPDLSIYAQSANLATVATSGDYEDLSNKPTIPSAVQTGTSSATSVTIAADHMTKMSSTAVSSITCTVTSDTTQMHEWAGKFTTGSSQTSVTIAMSNSATIEWASSPANLISGTKYAFSITGNATVGYNGTIVPFLY